LKGGCNDCSVSKGGEGGQLQLRVTASGSLVLTAERSLVVLLLLLPFAPVADVYRGCGALVPATAGVLLLLLLRGAVGSSSCCCRVLLAHYAAGICCCLL